MKNVLPIDDLSGMDDVIDGMTSLAIVVFNGALSFFFVLFQMDSLLQNHQRISLSPHPSFSLSGICMKYYN